MTIYPTDYPPEGQSWAAGAYSLYRRMAVQSLHDAAELAAEQARRQYQADLQELRIDRARWEQYGMSAADAQRFDAAEQQLLDCYNGQLLELAATIEQQQQAIHADYDARDQRYARSMAQLGESAEDGPPLLGRIEAPGRIEAEADQDEPGDSLLGRALAWFI